jgi:hypothetical protein
VAYTIPTATTFKTRFPEFGDEADDSITPFINAAAIWVDNIVWTEGDYPYAIIYLAAHYFKLYQQALLSAATGVGGGGDGGGETTIQTYLSAIEFEDFRVRFGSGGRTTASTTTGGAGGVSSSAQFMARTPYGMLFEQIRARNIVPFAIV